MRLILLEKKKKKKKHFKIKKPEEIVNRLKRKLLYRYIVVNKFIYVYLLARSRITPSAKL